jgi:hypothetical protein
MKQLAWLSFLLSGLIVGHASSAAAFCGFYVAGGDTSLFNDATQAVLMREGNRTVLSMQNNYDGPPEDFALVIPVPVVLQQENVKTLDVELFKKLDQLTAPRLVEYWEQDPCQFEWPETNMAFDSEMAMQAGGSDNGGVTVEAEFSVGEYDIVILGADDAVALEGWLNSNDYNIPDGASPYLDPYIDQGSYFFVAKVDPEKVTWAQEGDNTTGAVLSPLRFHYDTDTFSLPIRLGLINAEGEQDLIVYTLGVDQRYEAANYDNVFIPTNIEVVNEVRDAFGEFYRTLFDEVLEANSEAVVTEYSWNASTCDPCPGPTLDQTDYLLLGADVLFDDDENFRRNFVVTRLHARYNAENLGEDLIFQEASPVVGGREIRNDLDALEQGAAEDAQVNNFQGRYIIRHAWEGSVLCLAPNYGIWGGPPNGGDNGPISAMSPNSEGTSANAEGDDLLSDDLNELVLTPIPELGITGQKAPGLFGGEGCGCQSNETNHAGGILMGMLGFLIYFKRKNNRSHHV